MSKAATFAAVYATLRAAHDLADHVLQTDEQALGKAATSAWRRPLAGHVASYHLAQVAALVAVVPALGLRLRPSRVAAAVALSAGTHAVLDRRWPVRRVLEATGSPGFAQGTFTLAGARTDGSAPTETAALRVPLSGPYLADQALHHLCLWAAALVAVTGSSA